MILERLLGSFPTSKFLDECYFRIPFSQPGGAREWTHLGTWETVRTILQQKDVDAFCAREGQAWPGGTPSYEKARELHEQGYTIVIRNAQKHEPGLAKLAAEFETDLRAPVNVHMYCTPPKQHGFGWHYDVEDVFILQTQGTKTYYLRRNTVNPWPVLENMPKDLDFHRENMPVFDCRLIPGDWLYIPPGYWHVAKSDDATITLAVGLLSPTALNLLEWLRKELVRDIIWRQRLPVPDQADALKRHHEMFAELGRYLQRLLADEALARRFLASREDRSAENA